jgi:hypothetical protein
MNHKEQIRQLALTVGRGSTAYVEVHDAIFREAASFKSVVKNLFGRGVPMSRLLADSEQLLPLWSRIQGDMEAFRHASYSSLGEDERTHFNLLSCYANAVTKTVTVLVDRQRLLNEGSRGGANNPMTWKAFQEKESLYKAAVAEYVAVGQELDEAAHIVFD